MGAQPVPAAPKPQTPALCTPSLLPRNILVCRVSLQDAGLFLPGKLLALHLHSLFYYYFFSHSAHATNPTGGKAEKEEGFHRHQAKIPRCQSRAAPAACLLLKPLQQACSPSASGKDGLGGGGKNLPTPSPCCHGEPWQPPACLPTPSRGCPWIWGTPSVLAGLRAPRLAVPSIPAPLSGRKTWSNHGSVLQILIIR